MPNIDVKRLLLSGQTKLSEKHREEEKDKIGVLRGGTCGMADEGPKNKLMIVGGCPRLAWLRVLGYDKPVDDSTALLFSLGHSNEDIWYGELAASGYIESGGKILREAEVPIVWQLTPTRLVTGRPDIVLTDSAGVPNYGIELKQVCSLWTAKDVLQGKPKTSHVIQAGLYKWRLEQQFNKKIDWGLWYTSRVNFAVPDWAGKMLPKKGKELSEFCSYNDKEGKIKSVNPFVAGYEIGQLNSDGYEITHQLGTGKPVVIQSIVHPARIERFYRLVDAIDTGAVSDLGPRPTGLSVDGTPEKFSECSYCELEPVCNALEKNKTKWLASVESAGFTKL